MDNNDLVCERPQKRAAPPSTVRSSTAPKAQIQPLPHLPMTKPAQTYDLETLMLHGGQTSDPATGARAVPIYQSTSFTFHSPRHAAELFSLDEPGNVYTRMSNPTTDVLEKRIALLEGGVGALATSSGQAAATITMLTLLQAGDEVVAASTLYGGTYHLLADTLPKFGIKTTFVNPDDPENFRAAITDRTRAVYAETIGNPNLNVLDIERVAAVAHAHKIPLVLDCTFTTPYLCQAFKHGCNIVIHSTTKWIGGHGTSIGGIIVDGGNFDWARSGKFPGFTSPDASYNNIVFADDFGTLAFIQKARVQLMRDLGACISPFNSFLLLLGVETLHVRMRQHCDNAMNIANYLASHPAVSWVKYPGLKSHRSYDLAQKYLKDGWGGAIVVFGIVGGRKAGMKFIENLALWSHLANVGDAKSLVIHPASTTHVQLRKDELEAAGVTEDLIRLAVGLESVNDLKADLDQALRKSAELSVDPNNPTGSLVAGPDYNDEGLIRWVCSKAIRTHLVDGKEVVRPTTIAVVGLSNKEGRPSFRVARKMEWQMIMERPRPGLQQRLGYKIVPINPNLKEVLGERSYPSLAAVDFPVDVVQVFRARDQVIPVAEEALQNKDRLRIRAFWLQEGVIAPDAAAVVSAKGKPSMGMVMNRCTYKECQRLMGPMATYA